ncbi:MAG: hypothetical protein ABDH20_00760 [Thermus sp.]
MQRSKLRESELWPLVQALAKAANVDPQELPLLPLNVWEKALWAVLVEIAAERIVDGWDRYGAPSAARDPEGEGYIASAEVGPETILARGRTKREAYREARRAWVRRLLG